MGKPNNQFAKKIQKNSNKLKWKVLKRVKCFDPKKNILLCCNPRGGSTWLLDLIKLIPKTTAIWEPLHPDPKKGARIFKKLGFGLHQYIPQDVVWNEAKEAFTAIFNGKISTPFIRSATMPYEYFRANRMIIKFCRANAMLPWLTTNFNFNYKPIYLIRHPFAVVSSQLKHGAWKHKLSGLKVNNYPFQEYYSEHADFLSTLETKEDVLLARWCLSNVIPLKIPRSEQKWTTVHYENLLINPAQEINRIFDSWNINMPPRILDKVSRPSGTTKEATFRQSKELQLSKWEDRFNERQKESMDAILGHFGITHYSSKQIMPQ